MRNLIFARFSAAFRLELRQIGLHWSYVLLHGLWAFVLYSTIFGRNWGSAQWTFETGMIYVVRTLISGVTIFMAANSFARSSRIRFKAIDDTLPTGLEVWFGRWLACTLAAIVFIIEPSMMAFMQGPLASFVAGLIPFTVKAIIILGFATALSWLVISLLGSRRWVFLILAAAWVGLVVGSTFLQQSRLPFTSLFNLTGNGSPLTYTELFGTLPQGTNPVWFHLFYLAILCVLLASIASRLQAQRLHHVTRAVLLLGSATLIIALAAGTGYSTNILAAQAQEAYSSDVYTRRNADLVFPGKAPEVITRYDLAVDLTDLAAPRFTAHLTLNNRGTTPLASLHLTLHHGLTITESSEKLDRDGDFLTITPAAPLAPASNLSITLTYVGAPWYTDLIGGVPVANAFINAEGIRLPFEACWYPISGWVIPGSFFEPSLLMGGAAQFNLTVKGAPNMMFASNLPTAGERTFSAQAAAWATLVGSPRLVKSLVGSATLYTAQFDQPTLAAFVESYYTPTLAYILRFFPDIPVKGLIVFGMESAPLPAASTLIDGWLIIPTDRQTAWFIAPESAASQSGNQRGYLISYLLEPFFPESTEPVISAIPGGNGTTLGYGANSGLMDGISQFIELHKQLGGDAASIKQAIISVKAFDESLMGPNPLSASPALTFKTAILQTLVEIYAADGETAIIRVLHQIRFHQTELVALPPEKVDAWLQAAARVS